MRRILYTRASAYRYGRRFYDQLRYQGGWRGDAPYIILQELYEFVLCAADARFMPLSMWEYWQMVDVIRQYLQYRQDDHMSASMYRKICADLARIKKYLDEQALGLNEYELQSLDRARVLLKDELKGFAKEWARG